MPLNDGTARGRYTSARRQLLHARHRGRVRWAGTRRRRRGYDGIGLRAESYWAAGLGDAAMLALAEQRGVRILEVEYLIGWGAAADRDEAQQAKEQTVFHTAPAGQKDADCDDVPAERIVSVQMCDVRAEPMEPLRAVSLGHRQPPGRATRHGRNGSGIDRSRGHTCRDGGRGDSRRLTGCNSAGIGVTAGTASP
jgi:hypothetical protein